MKSQRNVKLSGLMLIMALVLMPLFYGVSPASASDNPTVTTNTATDIGNYTALLNGEVLASGGATVTEYGFYYGTDPSPQRKVTFNTSGAQLEKFNYEVNGLPAGVQYYYEAYATNANGTSYGYVLSFTTKSLDNSDTVPTVATNTAINIGNNTATLNGVLLASGGSTITEYGFYYGTSATPDTKVKVGSNIDAVESFNYQLSGLNTGTTYNFEAYAINSNGTAYGSTMNFTSTDVSNPVDVTPNTTFTINSLNYQVSGVNEITKVAPYIKDSRTLLPIIDVAYSLGMTDANVVWDEANQTITLTKGTRVVQLTMGSNMISVNNIDISTDVAPEISNGVRCLPIGVVARALGATVNWDGANRTVTVQ